MTKPQFPGGEDQPRPIKKVTRTYIDDETGVVQQLSHEEEIVQKRAPLDGNRAFVMVDPQQLGNPHFTGRDWQVFWYLAARMILEDGPDIGKIFYSTAETGEHLGIGHGQVNRCIRHLEKSNMLRRIGRRYLYLNPQYAWRGKALQRGAIAKEYHR